MLRIKFYRRGPETLTYAHSALVFDVWTVDLTKIGGVKKLNDAFDYATDRKLRVEVEVV